MPLTNAEKQRAYRERHLRADGEKARIQLFLSATAKAQLDRLARHKDYTVTALVEEMAAAVAEKGRGKIIPLAADFYDEDAPAVLTALLAGPADVVLSDMAAAAIGDTQTDHMRIMGLAETAHDFARQVLKPGGTFVAKVLRGGTERTLLDRLKRDFAKVRHVKPEASRADSAEMYVVGTGFRG